MQVLNCVKPTHIYIPDFYEKAFYRFGWRGGVDSCF